MRPARLVFKHWRGLVAAGHPGFRSGSEGPGAAQTEALWEASTSSRRAHPGETPPDGTYIPLRWPALYVDRTKWRFAAVSLFIPSLPGDIIPQIQSGTTSLPRGDFMKLSSHFPASGGSHLWLQTVHNRTSWFGLKYQIHYIYIACPVDGLCRTTESEPHSVLHTGPLSPCFSLFSVSVFTVILFSPCIQRKEHLEAMAR